MNRKHFGKYRATISGYFSSIFIVTSIIYQNESINHLILISLLYHVEIYHYHVN